jgi:BON domain
MFGRNQVPDKDLLKSINQRLARTGTSSQSKVNVSVQQGNVTLTGTLQHAVQRIPIVKAVTRVPGVRRVVDQLQHVVRKRPDFRTNAHLRATPSVKESPSVSEAADESAGTVDQAPADESTPE